MSEASWFDRLGRLFARVGGVSPSFLCMQSGLVVSSTNPPRRLHDFDIVLLLKIVNLPTKEGRTIHETVAYFVLESCMQNQTATMKTCTYA